MNIDQIAVAGISVCMPPDVENNHELHIEGADMKKLIRTTGIVERRVAKPTVTTSDLCIQGAETMLTTLEIPRSEIKVLVFVTQSPDFDLPSTAHLQQDRLGLPRDCLAIQVNEGCSGYVYGLYLVSSLMKTVGATYGLLLVGDVPSRTCGPNDKSTRPLFGDAGVATLLQRSADASLLRFDLGGDGSGFRDIIIPDGGARTPVTPASLVPQPDDQGLVRSRVNVHLDGMNVFLFGISTIPRELKRALQEMELTVADIDYFVFHQANKLMNEKIRKKLKIPAEKVPYSLEKYGNTSSATIPVTLAHHFGNRTEPIDADFIFCGFGVGVSWGTCHCRLDQLRYLHLQDYADDI